MKKFKEKSPVPKSKAFVIPKLDDDGLEFFGDDKQNVALVKQDRAFENIQATLMTAMGPLSQIWMILDSYRRNGCKGEANLHEMLELLEKAVICIGQTNVHASYLSFEEPVAIGPPGL